MDDVEAKSTILFYVDSSTMLPHAVAAAEILRQTIPSRIVMMTVDADRHLDETLKRYEVFDYSALFKKMPVSHQIWPKTFDTLSRSRRASRIFTWLRTYLRTIRRSLRVGRIVRKSKTFKKNIGIYWALRAIVRDANAMRKSWWGNIFFLLAIGPAFFTFKFLIRLWWIIKPAAAPLMVRAAKTGPQTAQIRSVGWGGARRFRAFAQTIEHQAYAYAARLVRPLDQSRYVVQVAARVKVFNVACDRLTYWLKAISGVKKFVAKIKPDIIILPEDNIETLSRAFVKFGLAESAPTVILPYTIPNPEEPAHFYQENPAHQTGSLFAQAIGGLWPKWRFRYLEHDLLRLPPSKILAIEAFGLSTPAPWTLNRGGARAIVVESDAQRDLYTRLDFPIEQLKVIGDINSSVLARGLAEQGARRQQLLTEYGMDDGIPIIVCAFPPDQYRGTDTRGFEFPDFEELLDAWMHCFACLQGKANVVVRPHPRLKLETLRRYECKHIRLSSAPTAELVPIADLYVASISATIRWAICCGIPVINYDSYRYRYQDYAAVQGVVAVETKQAFNAALQRFVTDKEYAADLAQLQHGASAHWGIVDEGFPDRFKGLILDQLATNKRRRNGVKNGAKTW